MDNAIILLIFFFFFADNAGEYFGTLAWRQNNRPQLTKCFYMCPTCPPHLFLAIVMNQKKLEKQQNGIEACSPSYINYRHYYCRCRYGCSKDSGSSSWHDTLCLFCILWIFALCLAYFQYKHVSSQRKKIIIILSHEMFW